MPTIGRQVAAFFEEISDFRTSRHLVLFYDRRELADVIQFFFLQLGLERGEKSIYVMLENDNKTALERRMAEFGIDVGRYKKKNLLHIIQVPDPLIHPDGMLAGQQELFGEILSKFRPPFRITDALSFINENTSHYAINAMIETERMFHQKINSTEGRKFPRTTLLCTYQLADLSKMMRDKGKWMKDFLESHHGVIYSTSGNYGLALIL